MENITVVELQIVSAFKCIGSEYRDHYCKGWDIPLDKSTVNRYLKSYRIEIKTLDHHDPKKPCQLGSHEA